MNELTKNKDKDKDKTKNKDNTLITDEEKLIKFYQNKYYCFDNFSSFKVEYDGYIFI